MVWADRFHHAYTKTGEPRPPAQSAGDPIKFEDHARQRHPLPGIPKAAGTPSDAMAATTVIRDRVAGFATSTNSRRAHGQRREAVFADYHTVFCSIDLDDLWGEDTLPYTGRMMIPLLIPASRARFPTGRSRCTTRRASFRHASRR